MAVATDWLKSLFGQRLFVDGTELLPTTKEWNLVGFAATYDSVTGRATITRATPKRQETFPALPAAGTNLHAQYAAGAPITSTTGFTLRFPRRTWRVVLGGAGVAVTYTLIGTAVDGGALVDTIVVAAGGGGTFSGLKAFDTITSFTSNVDPGDTTDLQTGNGFAVGAPISGTVDVLSVDSVVEAAASQDAASGTVVPTTAPNGAKHFAVRYKPMT